MEAAPVSRFRGLATSTLRLAAAIAVALLAVMAVCTSAYWVYTYPERQRAKAAEAVRDWAVDLSGSVGLKLQARTKLIDGNMRATLAVDGYPDYLSRPENRSRGFTLEWKDADGFTRTRKTVPLSEFSTMLNDKGKPNGLSGEFSEFVSVADYSVVTHLEVGWTFDTEARTEQLQPNQPATAKSDHCAPGLGRQERLRRLAQYGPLRETGYNSFSAGDHTVTLSGAEVIFCS